MRIERLTRQRLCEQKNAIVAGIAGGPVDKLRLPSFFMVGPPRTGTSWLYTVLRSHAALPGPSKATRFFDEHFRRGLKWYLAHYKPTAGQSVGEVAPTYFASAPARERIAEVVPQAKIVCTFRHPVERIVSLYRLKRAYGMIRCTLEEVFNQDPEFMATSRYARHLKFWQHSFGAENVFAALYDDLQENPQQFMNRLVDFVGIPRFSLSFAEESEFVHNSGSMTLPRSHYSARNALRLAGWLKSWRMDQLVIAFKRSRLRKLVHGGGPSFQPPSPEVLKKLHERLQPEIEPLEALLGRDLSAWRTPNVKPEDALEQLTCRE